MNRASPPIYFSANDKVCAAADCRGSLEPIADLSSHSRHFNLVQASHVLNSVTM
jgi:hypothetical protein